MNIKIFKRLLNILIISSMVVSFSMIANDNIVGYILFIVLILISAIINSNDKHN